jgi:pyrroline-5-carboxylate reductase
MTQNDTGMKISWVPQGDQKAKLQEATAIPAPQPALLPSPSWMIGAGNMGGAVIAGWRAAGVDLSTLNIIRPSGNPVEGVRTVKTLDHAGAAPKLVILAVKPQSLEDVEAQLRGHTAGTVIVSMLAGVTVASLRKRFPEAAAIVRAIPNLPVAVRRGVTGLYGENVDEATQKQIGELFARLGYTIWLNDEAKLAAVGALAGAGPAYVARFVRALAKAGEAQGLSSGTAATIALETAFGTAWLAASSGDTMDALAKQVASPNGTTEAGLAVLDRDAVLDQLIAVTIEAAARRGAELAEDAEAGSLA